VIAMAKRSRSTRSPRGGSDRQDFIPTPPPRKSFEQAMPDSIPQPGQRLLSHSAVPWAELRTPQPPLQRPEIPSVPTPGPRPRDNLAPSSRKVEASPGQPPAPDPHNWLERFAAHLNEKGEQGKAQEPPQNLGNQLIVPMVCAKTKQNFAVRFTRTYITDRWRFAEVFPFGDGNGTAAPKAMMVPVNEMNWTGVICPGCGKSCGPVLCGDCQQLGCDGGISFVAPLRRMYRCACGGMGLLEPSLKEVSGAKGTRAQEPQSGTPSQSTSLALRLPRPE
jgi:hypothetical protein